jgi:hypothetical protein
MSSTLLPPPREQLCNRSCSNKTHTPQGRNVRNVSFTFGQHAQRGGRSLEGSEDGFDEREGEDAVVRRGVILGRKRIMREVTQMRKRVTRRSGVRCMKPCQRWGVKITTRPLFAQGLKRRDPLHHHHPGRQCGLRMCSVCLYLLEY